jgi:hypothetical protein
MTRTINLNAEIPESRQLRITLPDDVPSGPAEIVITVSTQPPITTLGDLLQSEFFGMWRDRSDIIDSFQFALQLRSEGWNRSS